MTQINFGATQLELYPFFDFKKNPKKLERFDES